MRVGDLLRRALGRKLGREMGGEPVRAPTPRRIMSYSALPDSDPDLNGANRIHAPGAMWAPEGASENHAAAVSVSARAVRTDSDGRSTPMPALPPVCREAQPGDGAGAGRQPGTGYSTPTPEPPAYARPGRTLTPAVTKRGDVLLVDGPPPAQQAVRLLAWVQEGEDPPAEMLAGDMRQAYSEMCAELGWRERHWNPIAKHLAGMTGGKRYAWVPGEDGKQHRLRVYRLREGAGALPDPSARSRIAAEPGERAAA